MEYVLHYYRDKCFCFIVYRMMYFKYFIITRKMKDYLFQSIIFLTMKTKAIISLIMFNYFLYNNSYSIMSNNEFIY